MDNLREALRSGATIETLRAVGGSVRSDIWMRIKASVTNMPIEIPTSSLGAPGGLLAILGYRLGEYASIQEAVDANLQIERVVEPVPAWVPRYGEQFQMFKEYYRQLKGSLSEPTGWGKRSEESGGRQGGRYRRVARDRAADMLGNGRSGSECSARVSKKRRRRGGSGFPDPRHGARGVRFSCGFFQL